MKTPLALVLIAISAFVALPATAADRACRPSLSNFYHCPDNTPSAAPTTKTAAPSDRVCHPSVSSAKEDTGTSDNGRPPKKTVSTEEGGCRPSLSNGYKCPGSATSTDANQYSTEAKARAHCGGDTVVWANTRSKIYHFRGTANYGNTVAGAYMCEGDSIGEGMRAAKNETHP